MRISSPAFQDGSSIPPVYTCDGAPPSGGKRPALLFSDIPTEAKSLVVIVDDPDSPTGTWNHWTAWNINPARTGITDGETGEWVEGVTSFGDIGYGGPCPHGGVHRYFFKLHALDIKLDLKTGATKEGLEMAMAGHVIAEAQTFGTYARS